MSDHWVTWHDAYDDPASALHERLGVVQAAIVAALDDESRPVTRAVSLCAGQGRDLLPVLASHRRGRLVEATLVDLDEHNAAVARQSAVDAGLDRVRVVVADGAITDAYAGATPADLVLACGIFGNISDDDVERTVRCLPMFCAPGATVVWTRHHNPPDLTPAIRSWLATAGFDEVSFVAPTHAHYSVGVARWSGPAGALELGLRLFTFVR